MATLQLNEEETVIIIQAPAKVNLVLEITDKLQDGYHKLDTIFQSLTLADTLKVSKSRDHLNHIVVNYHSSLDFQDRSGFEVEASENNLVIKALRALEKKAKRTCPCQIELIKCIPAGGGLGGGSADAAAMLTAVNKLWELHYSADELRSVGSTFGADVPFCIEGGTARGLNKGEQIQQLTLPEFLLDSTVVLLFPNFGLSTPKVYGAWDLLKEERRRPAKGKAEQFCKMLEMGTLKSQNDLTALLSNDLEPAAWELEPKLKKITADLKEQGCYFSMLCGSGSTVFGLVSKKDHTADFRSKISSLGNVVFSDFAPLKRDKDFFNNK